jgi:ketosteroid isomerase-like protein
MTNILAGIVKEFSDAWGRADLEALMPHLADDFVFCASVGPEPGATWVGKEAAREGFRRMFSHDADWTPIPNEIFPFEDRVMLLWGYRREVDGEPVVVRGCDVFHFRGRLIVRKDAFRKVFG